MKHAPVQKFQCEMCSYYGPEVYHDEDSGNALCLHCTAVKDLDNPLIERMQQGRAVVFEYKTLSYRAQWSGRFVKTAHVQELVDEDCLDVEFDPKGLTVYTWKSS